MGASLIAHYIRESGNECFLEPLEAYQAALGAYKPHLMIFNHLLASHLAAYSRRLNSLGVKVAVLPNEGILYDKDVLDFNAGKFHTNAHVDKFFTWNEAHKSALVKSGIPRESVAVVGVPRFDYYHLPLKMGPHSGLNSGRKKILICTNFVISKFVDKGKSEADKFFAAWSSRIPRYKNYWESVQASYRSRKRLFQYIKKILESNLFDVTLRLHPGEDKEVYYRWYEKLTPQERQTIFLDKNPDICASILSCDIEVSCETCTTAIEAWIAGKPTVELVFEKNEFDYYEEHARVCRSCDDPNLIVGAILKELDGVDAALKRKRDDHLLKWCGNTNGEASRSVAAIVCDMLSNELAPDWTALRFQDKRRAIKLKIFQAFGKAYHYNPFSHIKKRLSVKGNPIKEFAYKKSIKPIDVKYAADQVSELLKGENPPV
jgi:surface carbohydrate biosynthesis protein